MKRKLFFWIYPPYLIVSLVAVVSFTVFTAESATQYFRDLSSLELAQTARLAANAVSSSLAADVTDDAGGSARVQTACDALVALTDVRLTVIDMNGLVLADTGADSHRMDFHLDREEVREAMESGSGSAIRKSVSTGVETAYEAVLVPASGPFAGTIVRAAMPFSIQGARRASLVSSVLAFGFALALAMSLVAIALSRRIERPILRMHSGALAFASGRLLEAIPEEGPLEIANLSSVMNRMAADLDARIKTVANQRNEVSAILNGMTEAVAVVSAVSAAPAADPVLRVTDANPAFRALFPAATSGTGTLMEITHSTELCEFMEVAIRTDGPLETGITLYGDAQATVENRRQIRLASAPLSAGSAVLVINDLTRLNRLETVRRDFTTNVSHELRTPVTAIRASLETLRDTGFSDPKYSDTFLEIALRGTERLEAILSDLMSLARIEEEEKNGLEKALLDCDTVVDSAIRDASERIAHAGMTVTIEGEKGLTILAHEGLVKQALVNLLDNAAKYAAEGRGIRVITAREGLYSAITVADRGPGIPERDRPRVFERFYRVDKARSRDSGGTGLGLSIVRHIALANSGTVRLECPPEGGSSFSILLPTDGSGI
jgi:two-component system, OmpR family, phosphate regulon sensor histidine kinase PhoR